MIYQRLLPVILFSALLHAASATYTGRIVDTGTPSRPIANATVMIKETGFTVYTDSTGTFSLGQTGSLPFCKRQTEHDPFSINGRSVSFTCAAAQTVRCILYTPDGRKNTTLLNNTFTQGRHTLSLSGLLAGRIVPGLYLADFTVSGSRFTVPLLLSDRSTGAADVSGGTGTGIIPGDIRTAAAPVPPAGTLIVSRGGFTTLEQALPAQSGNLGDLALTRTSKEQLIEHKIDSLLTLMTIEEKAGQMVQTQINFTNEYPGRLKNEDVAARGIGSVFNGGSDESQNGQPNTPESWAAAIDRIQKAVMSTSRLKIPIMYAQDCVHGVGTISGCTIFPHNIGLGCTGDSALIARIGAVTANECAGIGIRFNFAPCIATVRNERWGRTYEGFGETPEINTLLGTAYIRGMQSIAIPVAASTKHYLGDGGTDDGVNNGEMSISEVTMRAVHLPQYAAAVREMVATVMPSYHTWIHDGGNWKQTLDRHTLTSILKTDLGFDGFCISDWDAIPRACDSYQAECVTKAINAGLDMAMIVGDASVGEFINSILYAVENQLIPIERINDAVKRILRVKFRMGLFDNPYPDAGLRAQINSAEHRSVAREAVRKSLVLLKNEASVLPLKKDEKIAVVGSWADKIGAQCGGWTISWQGSTDHNEISGQTILKGLQEKGSNVTYSANADNIAEADKIVVVVGERPYAEQFGDCTVPDLSECENAGLIEQCYNSGKPVILVIVSGRPMVIDTEINWCKAVVAAWLPGGEGGGVADVLYGEHNFTGKLTHTWPASAGQIPINTGTVYADEKQGSGGEPLYPYGYGLTY
ncbi:MAG: glycoside hydrolase family 3 C-terminal domain-containing protein [Chitinispirillaceae bacterium]|nr:glycoside hydrolase family 3 C-terminal domain-containing protein [Chitinispirillaceae bacterium]